MASIAKKIIINTPVGKVFNFVTNPENWTRYVTSLTDVRDVSSQTVESGTTFRWTYRMLGMNFNGSGEVTENVKNRRFALQMKGGFPIKEKYVFSPAEKGTELSFEIEYEIPGKLMGSLANRVVIEKINKKEASTVLSKVKVLCEEL
jgi:ligand-binding SRPBCC domain-containing protein